MSSTDKLLQSQRGSILSQIMIAMGLLGVVVASSMTVLKKMNRASITTQSRDIEKDLADGIKLILADGRACTSTFGGLSYSSGSVTQIKDSSTPTVVKFVTTGTYINGQISITSMNLSAIAGTIPGSGTASATSRLSITMQRLKGNQISVVRSFNILSAINSSGSIVKCYAEIENIEQKFCVNGIGGSMAGGPPCQLQAYAPTATVNALPTLNWYAASTQYVYEYIKTASGLNLDATYVNVIGDNMTGTLTIANSKNIGVLNNFTVTTNATVSQTASSASYITSIGSATNYFAGNITAVSMNVINTPSTFSLGNGSDLLPGGSDTRVLNKGDLVRLLASPNTTLSANDKEKIAGHILNDPVNGKSFASIKAEILAKFDGDYGNEGAGSTSANLSVAGLYNSCKNNRKVVGISCITTGCSVICGDDEDPMPSISISNTANCTAVGMSPTSLATTAVGSIAITPAVGTALSTSCTRMYLTH